MLGIGADVVQIPRVELLLKKFKVEFALRILTGREHESYSRIKTENARAIYLAKRFAAKEAVAKAYGSGISEKVNFKTIEITNNAQGRPIANILTLKNCRVFVSISDDYPIAIAFALILL